MVVEPFSSTQVVSINHCNPTNPKSVLRQVVSTASHHWWSKVQNRKLPSLALQNAEKKKCLLFSTLGLLYWGGGVHFMLPSLNHWAARLYNLNFECCCSLLLSFLFWIIRLVSPFLMFLWKLSLISVFFHFYFQCRHLFQVIKWATVYWVSFLILLSLYKVVILFCHFVQRHYSFPRMSSVYGMALPCDWPCGACVPRHRLFISKKFRQAACCAGLY